MRLLREAVASWFGLRAAALDPLDDATVERMAIRLEGRRTAPGAGRVVNAARP